MIRYRLILLVICLCASLVFTLNYKRTHNQIEAQAGSDENELLKAIFPAATSFESKALEGENYYLVKNGNQELGYIIKVETQGYASPIVMLVGFDKTGKIEGVEILSQQETPDLGGKIAEIKTGQDKPWFFRQFSGKNVKALDLKNIQAITGATMTSKAVTDAVRESVEEFLVKIK